MSEALQPNNGETEGEKTVPVHPVIRWSITLLATSLLLLSIALLAEAMILHTLFSFLDPEATQDLGALVALFFFSLPRTVLS